MIMKQECLQFGNEINLLEKYPRSKRPIEERAQTVTIKDRLFARRFDKEYFDGTRNQGYGGLYYIPDFRQSVVIDIRNYYKLTAESKILDVGCARGFWMYDFRQLIPGIAVTGVDISQYAIDNA